MKKYIGSTVTRKVAESGKPNVYELVEYIARGSGTAVYKSSSKKHRILTHLHFLYLMSIVKYNLF